MAESTWGQPAAWDAAKLLIPKETAFELRREKLLLSIAEGDESAVVFHAGAGYGKTTVMAEWASEHRAQSCWYRLHESDNQFGRFLYGIAAALSGVTDAASLDADAGQAAEREMPKEAGERFFERCLPALPAEPVFICLDDFHLIHNETVLDFLLRFMEYGEGKARFFFTSKCGFPDFLAANLMRGGAREVSEDELRFEECETALLLRRMSGRELPPQTVREIHADTCGWPAGIAFAGLDLKNARTPSAGAPLFDTTHLYQYIFYEIFRRQAYDTQRFLTESSVLEVITPPLCDYALGRNDSAGMLRYLVREHLFLTRMDGEENAYLYGGLLGKFLRSRLPGGRRAEILWKAAQYHVRRGEWESAARCGMACGEKGCGIVAAVLKKRAAEMRSSGQHSRLRAWIDYLAEFRERLTDSDLFCMYECLYEDGEGERAAEFLREAAKKAYAKLRYDLYERYMRELAAVAREFPQGEREDDGEGRESEKSAACGKRMESGKYAACGKRVEGGRYTEDRIRAARLIEEEAREKLALRGIAMESFDDTEDEGALAEGDGQQAVLYVQCMGMLSVQGTGGEAVWRTKKTKELFACLFFENGRWTARDVLMERLWPEKPADKSAVLFHTTASYLRKTLAGIGASECLLVKDRSYALAMARVRSDLGTLDGWYRDLKSGRTPQEALDEKLPALYREGVMNGEDYIWLDTYREEAEQRFLWMLQTLAKKASAAGRYGEAAALLKKAAEVDMYALDVVEQIVECLIRCRDIAGAKRAYERLAEVSMELFNEKPERTFEEFVRKSV